MQQRIPCTIMRGGTSRALFFRREDLPEDVAAQNLILLSALGNPDPNGRLVDGLGGPISSTSKVAIIAARKGEPNTVDYTFGQGSHTSARIDRKGNCGNISSAVGPYAIDEGLVEIHEPETIVRIYNTNTKKYIIAHVPVKGGKAKVEGNYQIAGVLGSGARIALDFQSPGGTFNGSLLPTGEPREVLETEFGPIEVSLVDAAKPCVFVRARDLGLGGMELPAQIDADSALSMRLEAIRSAAAVQIGIVRERAEATQLSQAVPTIAFVSSPSEYRMTGGRVMPASEIDIVARMISMGKAHGAYPITGAIGAAGAARIEGSVVQEMIPPERRESASVRIGHPSGSVEVEADVRLEDGELKYLRGTVYRTARRIMDGWVYVPNAVSGRKD
jgi:2-methylaconitate cis-trans-isomerase PrpF